MYPTVFKKIAFKDKLRVNNFPVKSLIVMAVVLTLKKV